ncbi:guanylate kinase [hydrocarbon metagenome]|uniref:Guanylate kinase n=1 Tax=hydrocarbon metagenome TaxID=938273 RepID=A0A0W8E564_9ZZZZ
MRKKKGILFVLSGPSGVGKGTIKEALLKTMKDICLSISATTRKPRRDEIHGKDYFFVDDTEFEDMIMNDKLLEWANVYTNRYGTPRDFVLEQLGKGFDVLLEIDIQGALQVKNKMPEAVFIFLSPPNLDELARRLCTRGQDSQESIDLRLATCEAEMAHIKYYNYVVINNRIDEAVEKVRSIIQAERCKLNNLSLG